MGKEIVAQSDEIDEALIHTIEKVIANTQMILTSKDVWLTLNLLNSQASSSDLAQNTSHLLEFNTRVDILKNFYNDKNNFKVYRKSEVSTNDQNRFIEDEEATEKFTSILKKMFILK